MKIRTKLILLLLATAVVPLISVSALSFFSAKSALNEQLNLSVNTIVHDQTHRLEEFFLNALNDLKTWSNLLVMQDVQIDDEDGDLSNEITRLKSRYDIFKEILVLNGEGRVISSSRKESLGKNLSDADLYTVTKKGNTYAGNVGVSELSADPSINFAIPIRADYDAKTIIGTLVGVVDWGEVQTNILAKVMVAGHDQDAEHRLILMSEEKEIIYDSLSNAIIKAPPGLAKLSHDAGVREEMIENTGYLTAVTSTHGHDNAFDPGWTLHALVASKEAFAPVNRLRDQSLAIVIGVSILILIIGSLGAQQIVSPLLRVCNRLNDISQGEGDLTVKLEIKGKDVITQLSKAFNVFVEKIRITIQQVIQSSAQIAVGAEQMSQTAQKTNAAIQNQKQEMFQVVTAVTELASTVQEVARNAQQAAESTRQANEQANSGKQVVSENMKAIGQLAQEIDRAAIVVRDLEKDSESVGQILEVIRTIADQTNLLALNAAIEAARAGEQGRGFAVVADEVRTLASRTQEATGEIEQIIARLQDQSRMAVKAMQDGQKKSEQGVDRAASVHETLNEISESVTVVADMNTQIASATEQQTAVTDEINGMIANISTMIETTAEGAETTELAANELKRQIIQVQTLMGSFKT